MVYFLNKKDEKGPQDRMRPVDFISKELNFNADQKNKVEQLNKKHHETMRILSQDNKRLKDRLFISLSDPAVNEQEIDSLTSLIGDIEKEKDMVTFTHFRKILSLCNDHQKMKFQEIVTDALHRGGKNGQRPQRP